MLSGLTDAEAEGEDDDRDEAEQPDQQHPLPPRFPFHLFIFQSLCLSVCSFCQYVFSSHHVEAEGEDDDRDDEEQQQNSNKRRLMSQQKKLGMPFHLLPTSSSAFCS